MSSTTSPADDSKRTSNNSVTPAPITPLLKAQLPKLTPKIASGIRNILSRKG
jgi:hypothetical protein